MHFSFNKNKCEPQAKAQASPFIPRPETSRVVRL